MIQGMYFERVVEEAHAGPEVDEGVVGVHVSVYFVGAVAEFDGLMNVVAAGVHALAVAVICGGVLGPRQRGEGQRSRKQSGEQPNGARGGCALPCVSPLRRSQDIHAGLYLKNVELKFEP